MERFENRTDDSLNEQYEMASKIFAGEGRGKQYRSLRLGRLDVLAFVIPASSFIELHIVGRLFGTEILLAAIIPFLLLLLKIRSGHGNNLIS